jgi:alkanesulfonate monooxygenase SsuD/methylene tetrahydromethanopterin reductase-like flavin-dependent oxidoreductase (luciferase family)
MFGVKVTDHTDRYEQGEEWFTLLKRILAGGPEEFDYDTPHFPDLKGVFGQPASIQQPAPLTVSAAYSDTGREFAVRNVDFLLIGSYDKDGSRSLYNDVAERSRRIGRKDPPGLLCMLAPYIRETKKEAEDFFKHFAIDHSDDEMIENYLGTRAKTAASPAGTTVQSGKSGAAAGGIPLIGSPEDIVEQFVFIHKQGFSGATLTLPNFLDDLPIIIDRVLPLMEQAGLRASVSAGSPPLDSVEA